MIAHNPISGSKNSDILIICDHASACVPDGIDLGLQPAAMATHIALDIGAGALATGIASALDAPAILGRWSRLVVDTNRPVGHPEVVPAISDTMVIPGNQGLGDAALAHRLAIHAAFHSAIDRQIAEQPPALIVSVHSFTAQLASNPAPRRWPVAMLWNRDDRAIAPAHAALLAEQGIDGPIGLNEPYSGRILNHSMDRHAEARNIPYLGFEVRQDLLQTPEAIAHWASILTRAIRAARDHLATASPS